MADFIGDFGLTKSKLRPYVKGGLGVARNEAEADLFHSRGIAGRRESPDGTGTQLTWSLGAGAAYPLNDRVSLTAAYQYTELGSAETDAGIHGHRMRFDNLVSHVVTLGLRYTF